VTGIVVRAGARVGLAPLGAHRYADPSVMPRSTRKSPHVRMMVV